MKAVVTSENDKYAVEEVTLDPPKPGELRIKMAATGVCRSDLSVINGTIPLPKPLVLGHEGAGVVDEVGEGVADFAVGDPVVLSFNPACGHCFFCDQQQPQFCNAGAPNGLMLDGTSRVHRQDGSDLGVMQFLGCMAEYAIVPAISAQKIDPSIPLDKAALVGCGVMTGVGAAINTAASPRARLRPCSAAAVSGSRSSRAARSPARARSSPSTSPTTSWRWRSASAPPTSVNGSVDNGVLQVQGADRRPRARLHLRGRGRGGADGRGQRRRAARRHGDDRRRRQADRERALQRAAALHGRQDGQGELLRRHQLPLRLPDAPRPVSGRQGSTSTTW